MLRTNVKLSQQFEVKCEPDIFIEKSLCLILCISCEYLTINATVSHFWKRRKFPNNCFKLLTLVTNAEVSFLALLPTPLSYNKVGVSL